MESQRVRGMRNKKRSGKMGRGRMFHNNPVNSETLFQTCLCGVSLHKHTHTQCWRWVLGLTWLYTLTHIAPEFGGGEAEGGGGGDLEEEVATAAQWRLRDRLARSRSHPRTHTHMHTLCHLCHTTTVLVSGHAFSCEEGWLALHCLHNLDWPMERERESKRECFNSHFYHCLISN